MIHTDHINHVGGLSAWHTNEEVVWLDIAVDQRLLMDGLHAGDLSSPQKISQPNSRTSLQSTAMYVPTIKCGVELHITHVNP